MTQEENINYLRTLMIMHCGRAPWKYAPCVWYIRPAREPGEVRFEDHEVERHRSATHSDGCYFWNSEYDALSAYCEFYKLGPFAELPQEVT